MNALIKKAKQYVPQATGPKVKRPITFDETELTVEYLRGNVTYTQMLHALYPNYAGKPGANILYQRVPMVLREALRQGWISINLHRSKGAQSA